MTCVSLWNDGGEQQFAIMHPKMSQPLIARKTHGNHDYTSFMMICIHPDDWNFQIPEQSVILRPDEIEQRQKAAVQYGQEVDETIWKQLIHVASEVLVESTELSRLRGTGENAC